MGRLLLKDKVFFFICWFCFSSGLMMMFSTAEKEYFHLPEPLTWDEARNHCQACFADLVTVTHDNIQIILKNVTSESWIGLRKNFNSTNTTDSGTLGTSTNNTGMSWSRWADSALLTFQNWYPGWPVFKSIIPKQNCCSCACTCPATATPRWTTPVTDFTTQDVTSFTVQGDRTESFTDTMNSTQSLPEFNTTPDLPIEAECVHSPMLTPEVPDVNENYIEDSCVATLSFGAWIEKQCSDPLPFICYDESFVSSVTVTNVTSSSAILTWQPGPGDIDHYRLEVTDQDPVDTGANLTYDLGNLTAGTRYSVQVFAGKCNRNLSSQGVSFYTVPEEVLNLGVISVTETSVTLSWEKPSGNVNFYITKFQGKELKSNETEKVVDGLIPGGLYTFNIISAVLDRDTRSKEKTITTYTKPGKVSDLKVTENTQTTLLLSWRPPEGNTSGYIVTTVAPGSNKTENVTGTELDVKDLPQGRRVTLSVRAQINGTLIGDEVTVYSYTTPGPILNLSLKPSYNSISATWNPPKNTSSLHYIVTLQLEGNDVSTISNLTETKKTFEGLKTAANYTVSVSAVSGNFSGPAAMKSVFTLPLPPTGLTVCNADKTSLTFKWKAPEGAATVTYIVNISSSFWSHRFTETVENDTSHTFSDLKSGTKYSIKVQTKAGGELSNPVTVDHFTVSDTREISLSMLCSSTISLHCDSSSTRESVFNEFETYLKGELMDDIFWKLEKYNA